MDLIATEPLIEECAKGKSNNFIAQKFEVPVEYVTEVLRTMIGFSGWENDLDVSPLDIFDAFDGDWNYYKTTIDTVSTLTTFSEISKSYAICRNLTSIRKEIRKYVQ